ncbi:hypothetical protein K501DRAFT_191956 [Backusella circina FSU 941]|nr:hypothetical protein K501DRAFT_191956 [Backusella circina FSU 941]
MSLVDQVTEQLATLELQDEDISEYITGIIQDESIEEEEKREVITEFLAETTDKSTDALIDKLLKDWKALQQDQLNQEKEQKEKKLQQAKEQEKIRQEKAEQEQQQLLAERNAQKEKSTEEKKARDKLLEQYSYVQDGPENNNEQQSAAADTKGRKGRGHHNEPTGGNIYFYNV